MADAILTQEILKEQIHYDPDTGLFTRIKAVTNAIKAGYVCSYVSNYGYILISILGRQHNAQRLAWLYMTGSMPVNQIDHINGIRTDNRWCNLRQATSLENMRNQKRRCDNTSGFKGVAWDKQKNKWRAYANVDGKQKHLGRFDAPEIAYEAYVRFTKIHFGEFFRGA